MSAVADIFVAVVLYCAPPPHSPPGTPALMSAATCTIGKYEPPKLVDVAGCHQLAKSKAEEFTQKYADATVMGTKCLRLPDLMDSF